MIKLKKIVLFIIGVCLLLLLLSCKENNTSENSKVDSSIPKPPTNTEQMYGDFKYQVEDSAIKITGFAGNEENIIVPSEINGKSVRTVGSEAFSQQKNMKSITLPDSITSIESSAFYRCYSLEKIEIPKNVEQIGSNPFFRCSSLTEIVVNPESSKFSAIDGVLFNKDKTELIAYPEGKTDGEYIVPASVNTINGAVFGYHSNVKKITIPASVIIMPNENIFVYPDDVTLIVKSGSVAEKYAKDNGIKHEVN